MEKRYNNSKPLKICIILYFVIYFIRSEERRVGKECL